MNFILRKIYLPFEDFLNFITPITANTLTTEVANMAPTTIIAHFTSNVNSEIDIWLVQLTKKKKDKISKGQLAFIFQ